MTDTLAPAVPAAPAVPGFTLEPHQQQIHDFLVHQPFAGAWVNVGGGKSLSTLAVMQTVRPIGHILVVAPIAIARSTWIDEIEKWGFPIRTRSLIVNENDRLLSKEKRLERFQQVFQDPPTMYFINQDLLTQPSNEEHLLVPKPGVQIPVGLHARDYHVFTYLAGQGAMTKDELVEGFRQHERARSGDKRPVAKAKVAESIKNLLAAQLIVRETRPCRDCDGAGCSRCRFGLIDQMPIQKLAGPDGKKRDTIIWPFQTLIIDESQGFKSHSSARFKALATVRPAMNRVIELTGTPAPNGLHDLWSQIYLLDQGAALGKNITEYRRRWFTPKMVYGTQTPAKWIPNPNAEQEIYAAISHLVMSAKNTTLTLPDLSFQDVNVSLPPDLLQAYKEFKKDLVLDVVKTYVDEDGNLVKGISSIVAENQAVLQSKLMQFASGTLYTADPDDPSDKGSYQVLHDKKIEMAEYLVRNNGGEPMLIAYHFRSDKEQLLERLGKAGHDVQAFDGSREMIRRWNAKRIPVMLIHPASAGPGLNLQHGGSSMIWYTLPFSLEHYQQANGRLHRPGQTQPVVIYRFITKGTHDERMPSVLAGKALVQNSLLEAVSGTGPRLTPLEQQLYESALLTALEDEIQDDLSGLWRSDRV